MFKFVVIACAVVVANARPQNFIPHPPKLANYKSLSVFGTSPPVTPVTNTYVEPLIVRNVPTVQNVPINEIEKEQNRNARYQFSTNVQDHISDLTHTRDEVRDGLNVKGSYSYSDGYFKRTVHYVADDKGFRITGQETTPLGGPVVNNHGTADISTNAHGSHLAYRVQSVEVPGPVEKIVEDY